MGDQKHNKKISMDRVDTTHHGVYDKHILCQKCDGKLGDYDDYALDVCRRFPKEHSVVPDGMFEMKNIDGDKFATLYYRYFGDHQFHQGQSSEKYRSDHLATKLVMCFSVLSAWRACVVTN
jgi:hypothetical protein